MTQIRDPFSKPLKNMMGYALTIGNLEDTLDPNIIKNGEDNKSNPYFLILLNERNHIFIKYFLSKFMNFSLNIMYGKSENDI